MINYYEYALHQLFRMIQKDFRQWLLIKFSDLSRLIVFTLLLVNDVSAFTGKEDVGNDAIVYVSYIRKNLS
ncbi:hypothetical protein [Bacillus cereus]|uniref:hypothetical protein n=1 Tax=Bacillus cereus TaxID=1396 RepID=UPI0014192B70|nr:hypothetical protein [Bacillus cereus]MDA2274164.1 hypothetical protein [Bacillus cereus]